MSAKRVKVIDPDQSVALYDEGHRYYALLVNDGDTVKDPSANGIWRMPLEEWEQVALAIMELLAAKRIEELGYDPAE